MLISCPRCRAVYVINKEQIPERGKQFKCAECGKIWTAKQEDMYDVNPEKQKFKTQIVRPATEFDGDTDDIRRMFEVLDRDTKGLFENGPEKYTENEELNRLIRHAKVNISPLVINGCILIVILILSAFIAYFNRYDVVSIVPRMQYFYEKFGLESVYHGRNLKIKEVATKHIIKDGKHFIEAHGVILNDGDYRVTVPLMKIVVSGITGASLIEIIKNPVIPAIDAHFSSLFRVLIESLDNDPKILVISFLSPEEEKEIAEEKRIKAEQAKKGRKNVAGPSNGYDLSGNKRKQLERF